MSKHKRTPLTQQVTILRNEKEPESLELVAQAILDIDAAFKRIVNGPIKQHVIVLLLSHETKISQRDVKKVLDAAARLRNTILR